MHVPARDAGFLLLFIPGNTMLRGTFAYFPIDVITVLTEVLS